MAFFGKLVAIFTVAATAIGLYASILTIWDSKAPPESQEKKSIITPHIAPPKSELLGPTSNKPTTHEEQGNCVHTAEIVNQYNIHQDWLYDEFQKQLSNNRKGVRSNITTYELKGY